jgi:hypothetical protein
MDVCLLFHAITNFGKPRHSRVISRGIFAPHWIDSPTETGVNMSH